MKKVEDKKVNSHHHCPNCGCGILEEITYDPQGAICKCGNCKKLYRWFVDNGKIKEIKIHK